MAIDVVIITVAFPFQYYHTVTAVRRHDVSKSAMTKVMDLFRHRSNSAVSEADKRKAVSWINVDDGPIGYWMVCGEGEGEGKG